METTTARRVPPLFLGLCAVLLLFFFFLHHPGWPLSAPVKPASAALSRANSTLGFGAILAVSHAKSPRRNDLLYAADLTGIDIEIPDQPKWGDEDLENFRAPAGDDSKIDRGSAMAWMGHLNALVWFLASDLQTALILEDDVDWSIHLPAQIPPAARSIRTLLNTSTHSTDYWGAPSGWEILYLGHCGDIIPVSAYSSLSKTIYNDSSVPALSDLDPRTQTLFQKIGVPEHSRIAHRSASPLCTFAYAVTRNSAQRILETFGTEGTGGCPAFDVRILEACRDNHWLCYTISPELFHHIDAKSLISSVNQDAKKKEDDANDKDKDKDTKDEDKKDNDKTENDNENENEKKNEKKIIINKKKEKEEQEKKSLNEWRKERLRQTPNIGCRARQKGFWLDVKEKMAGFEWLKGRVKGGECLMDAMEEDMSRIPREL